MIFFPDFLVKKPPKDLLDDAKCPLDLKVITHWFLFSIFQNCWKMNVACPLVFLFPCQSCLQSTNLK